MEISIIGMVDEERFVYLGQASYPCEIGRDIVDKVDIVIFANNHDKALTILRKFFSVKHPYVLLRDATFQVTGVSLVTEAGKGEDKMALY